MTDEAGFDGRLNRFFHCGVTFSSKVGKLIDVQMEHEGSMTYPYLNFQFYFIFLILFFNMNSQGTVF